MGGKGLAFCFVFVLFFIRAARSLFGMRKRVHDIHGHKEGVAFLCYLVSTTRCLRRKRLLTITYFVEVSRAHLLESSTSSL